MNEEEKKSSQSFLKLKCYKKVEIWFEKKGHTICG